MPVKKDPTGRRFIELEIELPGTPDEVWQAIATGPGISSWFVPTEVEEREGGAVVFHIGPGLSSSGQVTEWQPPDRFAYEERDWFGDAPPLATECLIEARAGGTCRLRLVHSLFASDDDWDDQLKGMETGWPPHFEVLRLYLARFQGLPSTCLRLMGSHPGSEAAAWQALTGALGLADAAVGQRRETTVDGAPALAGTVERVEESVGYFGLILQLEDPAPGAALIGVASWGGRTMIAISLYFYGEAAAAVAAREEPAWQAWVSERFRMPDEADRAD